MSDADALTEDTIRDELPDGWEYDGEVVSTTYEFDGFADAVAFVVRVAFEAEAADHHPDLTISYNEVDVSLSSHDVGAVTQRDLDLAATIERLA